MARVRPVRGLRYGSLIRDKSLVVAPPYDVISRADQIKLHARHPKNIVWIDYGMERGGRTEEKYERAGATLEMFIAEEILVQDEKPSFYYYEQEFQLEGMGTLVRKGFICGLLLEKFGEGKVFPHERTLLSPKVDRLSLMQNTRTATSPIFGIYDDDENVVPVLFRETTERIDPDVAVIDDVGVTHRMWVVCDERLVGDVEGVLEQKNIFIADGHHRYETALAYRDWMRERAGSDWDSAWNYVLIFLSASGDDGLIILPTHRGVYGLKQDTVDSLIEKLQACFSVQRIEGGVEDMVKEVSEAKEQSHRFGLVDGRGACYLLTVEDPDTIEAKNLSSLPKAERNLDVSLLHGIILEKILAIGPEEIASGDKVKFYKDVKIGLRDLETKDIQFLFYLNPLTMQQFIEVSESGVILPQKSTYFYPKILTGLVLFPVGENDRVG